jgi:hypothetical protein
MAKKAKEKRRVPKMDNIEDVLKRLDQSKSKRSNFESTYESCRELFAPYMEKVNGKETDGDEFDFSKIWTTEQMEAVRVFQAGLQSYLTPRGAAWTELRMTNKDLQDNQAVKQYLEKVQEELLYTLNNSNFHTAIAEGYLQSIVFGTTTMMIDSDDHDRVRYTTLPIQNVTLIENANGQVSEFGIEQEMNAIQAAAKFGEENLDPEIRGMLKTEEGYTKMWCFVYHILNREYRDKTKRDKLNMPIATQWIDKTHKSRVVEGGFMEYPCATHRFYKRATSPYGYSGCTIALADARVLNKMAKTNMIGGMKYADPAMAVPSKGFLTKINGNPGAVNVYQRDVNKDSVFELPGGRGVPFTIEMEQRYADRIRRLLYNDTFRALSNVTKEMTVPEVRQRIQESLTQLGSAIGRFESEYLDGIIIRTIGILQRGGFLPAPPQELMIDPTYEIEYTSYLAQMRKEGNINQVFNGLNVLQQLAAFDPSVVDNLDADEAWKVAADIVGLPESITRTEPQKQEIREARAAQAAEESKMEAVGQIADAAGKVK